MDIGKVLVYGALVLSLSACQTGSTGETVGTLGGAAGGALIGSQFGKGSGRLAMTAVGTLAGALAGRELAGYLEGTDRQEASWAENLAVSDNEPIHWRNPSGNRSGVVEPTRTYQDAQGRTCRDYLHTIYVDGRAETARGTACREIDGIWRVVS